MACPRRREAVPCDPAAQQGARGHAGRGLVGMRARGLGLAAAGSPGRPSCRRDSRPVRHPDRVTRRRAISLLTGAAAVGLAGCGLIGSRASYRFRMTVDVQTPQGIRSGSSVNRLGRAPASSASLAA
jgi:hypothetical protein